MAIVPHKMKRDAIIEALIEIRFELPANSLAPEVLLGRLVDNEAWAGFEHRRFPIAEMPPAMRSADPQLKFMPVIELREPNGPRSVRIGPNVISYHRAAPYVGWSKFLPEIETLVLDLFRRAPGLVVNRLGLRYINAMNQADHEVGSVADLTLVTSIRSDQLVKSLIVASQFEVGAGTICTLRVSTPDFLLGSPIPENTSCVVDVDVFKEKPSEKQAGDVMAWVATAHTEEKAQFFRLLSDEKIGRLTES